MKKEKIKKLEKIPKINRRLFKIWSEKIRERGNNQCEYCGIAKGEVGKSGKIVNKLDSHHFISRVKKNSFLKWDLNNGVCVCSGCHKFSEDSFHRSPLTTIAWLIKNHPERAEYVLKYFNTKVDLENRDILKEIETKLNEDKPFDVDLLLKMSEISFKEKELKELEKKETTTTTTTEGTFSV
jgi:hypothetical protein